MGGYGSGVRATKKALLEDCWVLPAHATIKGLGASESPVMFQINYALPDAYGTRSAQLTAEATLLPSGGRRWWWTCGCRRKVAALYLPPGAADLRCRLCHDLAYRSTQQHDARIDHYRRNFLEAWDEMYATLSINRYFLIRRALETEPEPGGLRAAKKAVVSV